MNHVYFDTPGELDLKAITTFGLSVKETENPIGYFGTGLKYAIGILMRHRADIIINTNGDKYAFDIRSSAFRNKEYEAITMNDVELPFTTELGKNWKMWMAFREIYCNTLDEKGHTHVGDRELPEGWTRIMICDRDFYEVYCNRHEYFIENRTPSWISTGVEFYNMPSKALFYRNIRVSETPRPCLLTYNFVKQMDLTEDRTLTSPYLAEHCITTAVAKSDHEELIRTFVLAPQDTFEAQASFNEWMINTPSPSFMAVMKPLATDMSGRVNETAQRVYEKHRAEQDGINHEVVELTKPQSVMFERAKTFCSKMGHNVNGPNACPIIVVKTLGTGVIGCYKPREDKIYLALECFENGTKMVAGTLMEELIHKETGHRDFSRGFQNHLINKIVSMYEELEGEPL
jgi:hypothetical protein